MDFKDLVLIALAISLVIQTALYIPLIRFRKNRANLEMERDALTGLPLLAGFESILETEVHRGGRYHYPISVCYLDLDDFASLNANRGPRRGDEILREFSHLLKGCIRGTDSAARAQNDEFWVLLPHTDAARAEKFLARLQQETEEKLETGFSAGVASFQPGEDGPRLLMRARTALVQAKGEGRRKFCILTHEIPAATVR